MNGYSDGGWSAVDGELSDGSVRLGGPNDDSQVVENLFEAY